MKVLHVISGLKGGGAEHVVLELCRCSINDPDISMNVLTMSAVDEISHKFSEVGIEIIAVSAQKQRRRIKATEAFRLLLTQTHEVFHAHMFHACIVACITKLFRPATKVIFTLHNDHVPQFHRQLLLYLTRGLRQTDIIFPGMKRRWFQKKNPAFVPNGIDTARFINHDKTKPCVFTFVFAGRLEQEKNPLSLVDMAKSLRHSSNNFVISVAGDGPLKAELEKAIASEDLQPYFKLYGHVDNLPDLLMSSHCLLIPSHREGMPLILLEGAAAGLPIVTAPVGVIPSLVADDEGYIAQVNDFAGTMKRIMEDYDAALRKARRLKQKITAFYSIEKSYSMHKDIYRSH